MLRRAPTTRSPSRTSTPLARDDGGDDAHPSPWYARAGQRVVRRPVEWARRPWPTGRTVRFAVTAVSLIITTVVMMNVVHLNPFNMRSDLIFDNNTPTGGDMGAHVWGPAYLRDNLLPNWQLSGWSMDWYAGFPMYRFYMVVPALAIVALDTILPYGVAFKLVAVAGLVTLPFCCWAFGRLARFRYPLPELFAFAGLCFAARRELQHLRRQPQVDDGGRVLVLDRPQLDDPRLGLAGAGHADRRQVRNWAAIVLALAVVCHGIVADLRGGGRGDHRARLPRLGATPGARGEHRAVRHPAVGVVDRAVRRQPPVHDRHEVRRPPGRRRPTRSGTCSSRSPRRSTSSSRRSP